MLDVDNELKGGGEGQRALVQYEMGQSKRLQQPAAAADAAAAVMALSSGFSVQLSVRSGNCRGY